MQSKFLIARQIVFLILLCYQINGYSAQSRLALVIGNSHYQNSPLVNPVNDATDMAGQLKRLGFEVMLHIDLDRKGMRQVIREFGERLKKVDVGLFYYAGHGIQMNGRNYLVPVRIDLSAPDEVEDESIDAGVVLRKMETAGNDVNIVILDACRNNPFASSYRSIKQGLARMDGPVGSLIAYSTAPGRVASDGRGRNGLYTGFLLQALQQKDLTIEQTFKQVRNQIRQVTNGAQIPWESSSLTGEFIFNPDSNPQLAQAASEPALTPAAKAYLQVITNVENAHVFVNNIERGVTDQQRVLNIADLKAEPVEVTVELEGYARKKAIVQLTENQWQQNNIQLQPKQTRACLTGKTALLILKSTFQKPDNQSLTRINPPVIYSMLNQAFNQHGLTLVNANVVKRKKKRRLFNRAQSGDYARIARAAHASLLLSGFISVTEEPIKALSTNMKSIYGGISLEAVNVVNGKILAAQTQHFRTIAINHAYFFEKKGESILTQLSKALSQQVCANMAMIK